MKKLLLFGAIVFGLNAFGQANNNYSIEFDGIDDYIEIPAAYDIPEKTISVTFKLKNYPTSDLAMLYNSVSALNTSNGINQISIRQDSTLHVNVGTNTNDLNPPVLIPKNAWLNVSITINSSMTYIYLNGNLVDSIASGTTPGNSTFDIITFGCFKSNQGILRYFDGLINRISIWNFTLSQQEIQSIIDCPPLGNEVGLVGYWDMEEGSGTTTADQSINTNDGILTNGPIWSNDVPTYNCGVGIEELLQTKKELVKIIDLMGRETAFKPNTPLIFIYSDGTRERVMKIEE